MGQTEQARALRILIVEDDQILRRLIERHLGRQGFESVTASSGLQALEVLEAMRIDLVLTDLIMPEADGFEVLKKLRTRPGAPPVILMTGAGRGAAGEYVEIARVLGAAAVLQKPFSLDALTDMIRQFAGPPATGDQSPPAAGA